ncbi:glycoside hydrolase family 31 protein [Amniculicola lignicola CBS 123094]|uniref:Glycoside hydrolase family 31 protein n=1 Tax=Amniculicola lignicola CBS 123094 TaxID=1392246 RepID=A0A6A5W3T7_9PLEO|nr:glycoside hydrolase family 31 protein [Amniculicola lignicola CBS 123094]
MRTLQLLLHMAAIFPAFSAYEIKLTIGNGLIVTDGNRTIVSNVALLTGSKNTTTSALKNTTQGLSYRFITPTIVKVQLNTTNNFHGARFSDSPNAHTFGVWEYPFNNQITNKGVSFDLKGVANNPGINWANARAPFYFSSAGYGVYADTLKMGSYDFSTPGEVQFIFNSSSLVYYIILPTSPNNFKSIIEQYTGLSARSEVPPISAYGPTFWSDDFTQDFHGNVTNAAGNILDVVDNLNEHEIRASATFADRPYGTGNRSWGNFDFDPQQYPDPPGLIKTLSARGFDFQVWISNRGQCCNTEIYNTGLENKWLFEGLSPVGALGPALNLSITEAYDYFEKRLSVFPSLGVKGYKIDRGEEGEYPDYIQNEQTSLFIKLAYDTMVKKWGASNFYNFARSATDRDRKYTAIWNGDSHASFTGLAYSVASGIRSGLISFSIWGSDTGGYTRDGGALSPTEDVWKRWMWFSAFSPVYEIMVGTGHTPWYSPYTKSTIDVLRQTTDLHHELIPYIRTYAYHASKTGIPIMRALFLEAPADAKAFEVNDQYFFGDGLMVAPIVTEGGRREVYFPVGPSKKYLNYWNFVNKTVHDAGTTATVTMDTTSIPVYIVQGAIIVRGDIHRGNLYWLYDNESWESRLQINVYPSYDVPSSVQTIIVGEGKEQREVEIRLITDRAKKEVRVEYGAVGPRVELSSYAGRNGINTRLDEEGGVVVMREVTPLF